MSYKDLCYDYKVRLENKRTELRNSIETNKRVKKISKELDDLNKLRDMFSDIVKKSSIVRVASQTAYIPFKKNRIDNFKNIVQTNIDTVFPYENYKVEIDFDPGIKNSSCELYFRTPCGDTVIPSISEGKMFQELVSFSSAISVVESLGKRKLYLDEAFAASDEENLTEMSNILNMLTNSGFQIFLIEQHRNCYKDIPRREFILKKNFLNGSSFIEECKDF